MKTFFASLAMLAFASICPGLAPSETALPISSFIVTNNSIGVGPNTGTMLALENNGLVNVQTFETGGTAETGGYGGLNEVITVANGPNACIYLSDQYSDDIAGFIYSSTGLAKVGNFTGPGATGEYGIGLAAHNTTLVSAYSPSGVLAVWSIQSDCSLTLVSTLDNQLSFVGLTISPDGKTVTVAYDDPQEVDSYSLQPDGTLVEHGPYASFSYADGGDITPDGHYAIFGEFEDVLQKATAVAIYPIHPDGSLGSPTDFTDLGGGGYAESVSLSPDAKYLYVSDNVSSEVVSLAFSEDPPNLTPVWHQRGGHTRRQGHLAVISKSGQTFVAAALSGHVSSAVSLYQANSDGTLAQVSNSPFVVDGEPGVRSLAAWPPRGF